MKKDQIVKRLAAAALTGCLVFTAAGCTKSVSAAAYKTVNGVTEGNYEVSTDDMGSASFDVRGNHVVMTNFAFDADAALKVEAEINEEDLVYTQVYVHDDGEVIQNIADGHYPEIFSPDNAVQIFNTLYQTILGGTDEPVTEEVVSLDRGVLVTALELNDGQMFLLAKDGSDEFASIAVTTAEYGSQEIIDAAFDALKDEEAPAAEEQEIEEETAEAADAVVPEENTETIYEYPVYCHETEDPYYLPACQFIMDTYGPYFEPCDIMIPFVNILRVDDSDPEDIKVWGNYKLFNYTKCGTTLMTQSGGSFPGLIHMVREGEAITGVSMDEAENGSAYDESVKKIFGADDELLQAFYQSEEDGAEQELNRNTFRWYKEDTGLDIEAYEDYGWDPVYFEEEEQPVLEYPVLEGTWESDGAVMMISDPEEGSVYEVTIWAGQEDGSDLRYDLYGQYEFSTGALYYWDGWVSQVYEDGTEEELGNGALGYLGCEEDGTIAWYSVNDETKIWFEQTAGGEE